MEAGGQIFILDTRRLSGGDLSVAGKELETETGTKPMSKDDNKEVVTTDELIMAQMIRLDAIAQLLIEKGVISEEEFYSKLKNVQAQYQNVSES